MFFCPCTKGELAGQGELNLAEHNQFFQITASLRERLLDLNYSLLRTATIKDLQERAEVGSDYRARLRRANVLVGFCVSQDSGDQRWYASLVRGEARRRRIPAMIIFFSPILCARDLHTIYPCLWNENPDKVAGAVASIVEDHRRPVTSARDEGLNLIELPEASWRVDCLSEPISVFVC